MNLRIQLTIIVLALLAGALGGLIFDRFIVGQLAGWPGLGWVTKLVANSPIVITRHEQIVLNEGANLIELAKQAASATVSIYQPSSLAFLGNGIILSADGLVFTSKDAVGNLQQVLVVLSNGVGYEAAVKATDPKSVLVALQLPAQNLSVLPMGEAHKMQPGQKVLTVGQLHREFNRDFAQGVVTRAVGSRGFFEVASSESLSETILTDLRLNRAFMGSPVINLDGRLIGMVADERGKIVIAENVQTGLTSYLSAGRFVRSGVGVNYTELSVMGAGLRGLDRPGVLVIVVHKSSPAASAGLAVNDLIFEIDGQAVAGTSFEQSLHRHALGEMKLRVLRGGKELELVINLEETQ